jgi:hypothetical protein
MLTATLLNLGNEGFIEILSHPEDHIQLRKKGELDQACHPDEKELIKQLFKDTDTIRGNQGQKKGRSLLWIFNLHGRIVKATNIQKALPKAPITKPVSIVAILSIVIILINLTNVHSDMPLDELLVLGFGTMLFVLGTLFMFLSFIIFPMVNADTIGAKLARLFGLESIFVLAFALAALFLVIKLLNQTGWILICTLGGIVLLNLFYFLGLKSFTGITKASLKDSIRQLQNDLIHNHLRVTTNHDYLKYLSYAYGLGVQEQWTNHFKGSSFTKKCPDFMDRRFWDGGGVRTLFETINRLTESVDISDDPSRP